MIDPPDRVELPEDDQLRHERIARVLAVLIVVATLGVAAVEYLHAIADKSADAAATQAQLLSIERQGELVRANAAALTSSATYTYSVLQRIGQQVAFQYYLLPSVAAGSNRATLTQLEEERWSILAALTQALTPIKPGDVTSPDTDMRFPNVLLSEGHMASDRLLARQDAQNLLRSDWQARSGLLSVVLTMLAVAIYLFGLSLTLQPTVRRWIMGLGLTLTVLAGLAVPVLQFSSPSVVPDTAAEAYAAGERALNSFYTQPGDEGLLEAERDFTQAITIGPRFAQAYVARSSVRFLLGSPERGDGIASLASVAALSAQGDDLQTAYNLGLRDKRVMASLAANRLLLAIMSDRADYYAAAITYLARAQQIDPNDPVLLYDEGLALLGLGKSAEAHKMYDQAVSHTLYVDAADRTRRNDAVAEEGYVGSALTTLDLLAGKRSDLVSQIRGTKEFIVNGVDRNQRAPGTAASMTLRDIEIFPSDAEWIADIAGVDPISANVSTQWYYEAPQKLGWSVLSAMSGVAVSEASGRGTVNNAVYVNRNSGNSSGQYYLFNSSLATSGQCLQPGYYKVEVYINGRLAGTMSADGTNPVMQAEAMPDLGLSFCRAQSWTRDQSNFLRGFSDGFTSGDGTEGAYFFVFQVPTVPAGASAASESARIRDEVLSLFSSVLPADAGTPAIDCGASANGSKTLPWGVTLNPDCSRLNPYAFGLDGATEGWYDYQGGTLHIGTGVTAAGAVACVFTFGPSNEWTGPQEPYPDSVFDSIVSAP